MFVELNQTWGKHNKMEDSGEHATTGGEDVRCWPHLREGIHSTLSEEGGEMGQVLFFCCLTFLFSLFLSFMLLQFYMLINASICENTYVGLPLKP